MKFSWFCASLLIFLTVMAYSDFAQTFKFSIIFTLALEALGVKLYRKYRPLDFDETPFEDLEYENAEMIATHSKFSFRNSNRRKTAIPCLCSTSNFKSLSTGNEEIMSGLHKNLKDLVINDKNSWAAMEKVCEISLLDRLQQKHNYLIDLLKVLNHLSKQTLSETKELEDSMLFAVKLMEKDIKKSQKDLFERLKKSGEASLQELSKIKKYSEKVIQIKSDLSELNAALQINIGKPENFDANLKLESKIRISNNKISKNSHKVEISKDNFLKENSKYFESAQKLYLEFLEVNKLKGESCRSNLQCYLTHVQNIWKQSHSELQRLAEPGNSLNESIRTLDDEAEKSTRKASSLLSDLKEQLIKLDKLVETLSSIEKDHMKKFVSIFEAWEVSNDIGIDSGYFEFLHSVNILSENLKDFLKECEFIRQNISNHLKNFIIDNSEENLVQQTANLLEIKNLLLSILLSNFSEKVKIISAAAKSFEVNDEIKEMLSFSKNSAGHVFLCPYFTEGIHIEFDSKTKQKNTENAKWLNVLIQVYLDEWRTSDKFQDYICKKIAKKLNKDNPGFIGSISVKDFRYFGQAPSVRDFLCKSYNELEFNYELCIHAPGQVVFTVKVPLVFPFVKWEVEAVIRVIDFNGKVRICYTSEMDFQSWYSFAQMPDLTLEIFPLVRGKWLNFNQVPGIRWIVSKLVGLKLRRYLYPHRRSIKIPKARPKKEEYP
jgi:hypothetical protein